VKHNRVTTVRSRLILGNNQLDALFSCIYLFNFYTRFERHSARHQEIELY